MRREEPNVANLYANFLSDLPHHRLLTGFTGLHKSRQRTVKPLLKAGSCREKQLISLGDEYDDAG